MLHLTWCKSKVSPYAFRGESALSCWLKCFLHHFSIGLQPSYLIPDAFVWLHVCVQVRLKGCKWPNDTITAWLHKLMFLYVRHLWMYACVCERVSVFLHASWQPYLHPPWVRSHFRLDGSKITAPLPLHTFTHTCCFLWTQEHIDQGWTWTFYLFLR